MQCPPAIMEDQPAIGVAQRKYLGARPQFRSGRVVEWVEALRAARPPAARPAAGGPPPAQPLTTPELEVGRGIADGPRHQLSADRHLISLDPVRRSHLRNVYHKQRLVFRTKLLAHTLQQQ